MKNELVIILASYIGAMKGQGYQMSEDQEDRLIKLVGSQEYYKILINFYETDFLLVDAALNFLEENLNAN